MVPRDDTADNQVPVAFVIPKTPPADEQELTQSLTAHCEQVLDEWHRPADYRIATEFPLTKVGKVDYRELERRLSG